MPNYSGESLVNTLATAVAADANVKAKLWDRQLELGAASVDDFNPFEGPEGSKKPFIVKRGLTANAGDEIKMTVMSTPRGSGVRGETPLTGNESVVDFKTYGCIVDFWRDGITFTEKQLKFLAVGGGVKMAALNALKKKLGLRRMNDMKMALKLRGSGNTIYPNGKKTLASLTALDTMSPSLISTAKPIWTRLGGRPIEIEYSKNGSPVYRPLCYIPDAGMAGIRNSSSYNQAIEQAGARGDTNPRFSGKLYDWQGVMLHEHISVDPENNVYADPLAPRAELGVGFGVDSAIGDCDLVQIASDTKTLFFEYFAGYAKEWYEGQSSVSAESSFYSAINATIGYAWILNPDGSVGFVRWTGNANNGNKIQLDQILSPDGAGTSTIGSVTVGNIDCTGDTWDSTAALGGVGSGNTFDNFNYTDTFTAGAYIIPANANGVPDMSALMLGVGSAVRAYVGTDKMLNKEDDYGFVHGGGYQTIFGQAPCIRTDGKTNGYALIRHGGQHEGLEVPALNA